MEGRSDRARGRGLLVALAILAAVIALLAIGLVLGLGPFADEASEEDFLAQGDEICAEGRERFAEAQSQAAGKTPREAVALTDELIAVTEDELGEMRGLDPPGGLQDSFDRYLDAREQGVELLREGRAAAESADLFEYESAQAKLARGQAKRLELARAVGFTECSTLEPSREAVEDDSEPPAAPDPSAPPTVGGPPTGSN